MDNEIIVGLDIGTTKIACFVGMRTENRKVKILGFGKTESVGVENGVVKSITGTADSITKAVEEAQNSRALLSTRYGSVSPDSTLNPTPVTAASWCRQTTR